MSEEEIEKLVEEALKEKSTAERIANEVIDTSSGEERVNTDAESLTKIVKVLGLGITRCMDAISDLQKEVRELKKKLNE